MNGQTQTDFLPLAAKIARLVEERGWNQEDFSRIANLNRQTVRQILDPKTQNNRKLRNTTVSSCAKALGLSVLDLRTLPLDRLLARMNRQAPAANDDHLRRLYDQASQPELRAWVERNPERAARLTAEEMDELLSLQGVGGPLTSFGVERAVENIERKHRLLQKIHAVAGTEYLDVLEKLVDLMFDKVRPLGDRT
jgi:hypothetical protein